MARNPYRRYEVTEYQKEALKFLQPPEDITVSEWADKYRVLDAKTSAMPGPWRTEHTPYLKGIMDEFNNYETEEIVYVKPTQVGGTECLQNMVGYIVQQDPAPTMIVYPTDTLAKSISENRLQPMFKAAPELRKRFDENSQLQELQFDGMYLTLAGSNSPSSLASKAIRFLFLDEVDKYPGASKKEADPVSLARERTKTFHNRKIFITSTPTLKTGHIWKAKEDADIEKHYFVPCPHCGEYIELKWKQIHFPKEEGMSYADRAEFATYVCQECGCVITDQDKPEMLRKGEWRTVKENTKFVRKVAFWMNTLYSPFVRFSEIVKEFLDSKDDPEKLQKQNCDVTGTQSFTQMMRMCVKRKKVDGGILIIKRYTKDGYLPFKLQTFEVDELDNSQMLPKKKGNKVVGGIEMNEYNKPMYTLFYSPTISTSGNTQAVNPLYRYKDSITVVEDPTINALCGGFGNVMPWWLLGAKDDTDFIEVDYLNGQEIPTIRRMETPGTLGFVWDIYLDWGISVMDYRGAIKNPGIEVKNPIELA